MNRISRDLRVSKKALRWARSVRYFVYSPIRFTPKTLNKFNKDTIRKFPCTGYIVSGILGLYLTIFLGIILIPMNIQRPNSFLKGLTSVVKNLAGIDPELNEPH